MPAPPDQSRPDPGERLGVDVDSSAERIRHLLRHRPPLTRTYRLPPELVGRIPLDRRIGLRTMTRQEVLELAGYLGAAPPDLDGPLRVVDASCPSCGRRLTFLDFVATAIDAGWHERERLRDVLTGRAGLWITIRGLDGGRPVRCARCGDVARLPCDYSEYSSTWYTYA